MLRPTDTGGLKSGTFAGMKTKVNYLILLSICFFLMAGCSDPFTRCIHLEKPDEYKIMENGVSFSANQEYWFNFDRPGGYDGLDYPVWITAKGLKNLRVVSCSFTVPEMDLCVDKNIGKEIKVIPSSSENEYTEYCSVNLYGNNTILIDDLKNEYFSNTGKKISDIGLFNKIRKKKIAIVSYLFEYETEYGSYKIKVDYKCNIKSSVAVRFIAEAMSV